VYKDCKPEVGIPTRYSLLVITDCYYSQNAIFLIVIFKGIVTEKSPYSEHVYVEAAYKQGWIAKTSRTYFYKVKLALLILVGLRADSDPVFFSQCGSGSREPTNADPDLVILLSHKKVEFFHEKYTYVDKSHKSYLRRYKNLFERLKSCLFVIFCHFPSSGIRIRIPDMDPDPELGEPNQCCFGFTTLIKLYCPVLVANSFTNI
jgi:hypothetical protein